MKNKTVPPDVKDFKGIAPIRSNNEVLFFSSQLLTAAATVMIVNVTPKSRIRIKSIYGFCRDTAANVFYPVNVEIIDAPAKVMNTPPQLTVPQLGATFTQTYIWPFTNAKNKEEVNLLLPAGNTYEFRVQEFGVPPAATRVFQLHVEYQNA